MHAFSTLWRGKFTHRGKAQPPGGAGLAVAGKQTWPRGRDLGKQCVDRRRANGIAIREEVGGEMRRPGASSAGADATGAR